MALDLGQNSEECHWKPLSDLLGISIDNYFLMSAFNPFNYVYLIVLFLISISCTVSKYITSI